MVWQIEYSRLDSHGSYARGLPDQTAGRYSSGAGHIAFLCKDWADWSAFSRFSVLSWAVTKDREKRAMKLLIEIIAAALLVICISASSAAFAAGKMGPSADGQSCTFSVPANAPPAARCAAIKKQCGGKFHASACGDKMLSAN
jgi:hypothetical protein